MDSLSRRLHICFFPFMAQGHIIPTVDMAKMFSSRGVKASIITTPLNANLISNSVDKAKSLGIDIGIELIRFPATEAGLPESCENVDFIIVRENNDDLANRFMDATKMLQAPLEKLLEVTRPDCLVSDMFFPWTTDAAAKFGIPRLVFHGTSYFALSIGECLSTYDPQKYAASESDQFTVPSLPGNINLARQMLPESKNVSSSFMEIVKAARESDRTSFGVIVNSFYELEPMYADFYRSSLGRRAWQIGPVSLFNRDVEEKATRGKQATITNDDCLNWLNSKQPYSVIYVCFGSTSNFTSIQLKQIAIALEGSARDFIWVVRRESTAEKEEKDDWLPEGFEVKVEGKGLLITGWAPQVLILEHIAVGVFVTHCGWNSTLEGITAGKTMITWPLFNDQFYNEKFVTEVLKIGVSLGIRRSVTVYGEFVDSQTIEQAINRVTEDEEADEMRTRAKMLGELAKQAIEPQGSSSAQFNSLIKELTSSGISVSQTS